MSKYEPTAPWNEDFMAQLSHIGRSLERIAIQLEDLNVRQRQADDDIWTEIHNINGHLDSVVVSLETLAMEVDQ